MVEGLTEAMVAIEGENMRPVTWVESESCCAHDASERVNAAHRSVGGRRCADLQVYSSCVGLGFASPRRLHLHVTAIDLDALDKELAVAPLGVAGP